MYNNYDETALVTMDKYYAQITSPDNDSSFRSRIYKKMLDLYNTSEVVRSVWDWCETVRKLANRFVKRVGKVTQTLKKLGKRRGSMWDEFIEWNGCNQFKEGTQQVYFIRLLDSAKNLLWSKVGTTTRDTIERMREHTHGYKEASYVVVDGVFDCGTRDAEAYESYFRARFIFDNPGTFIKNDRFAGVTFNMEEVRAEVARLQRQYA